MEPKNYSLRCNSEMSLRRSLSSISRNTSERFANQSCLRCFWDAGWNVYVVWISSLLSKQPLTFLCYVPYVLTLSRYLACVSWPASIFVFCSLNTVLSFLVHVSWVLSFNVLFIHSSFTLCFWFWFWPVSHVFTCLKCLRCLILFIAFGFLHYVSVPNKQP